MDPLWYSPIQNHPEPGGWSTAQSDKNHCGNTSRDSFLLQTSQVSSMVKFHLSHKFHIHRPRDRAASHELLGIDVGLLPGRVWCGGTQFLGPPDPWVAQGTCLHYQGRHLGAKVQGT